MFERSVLTVDSVVEKGRISKFLKDQTRKLHRKGIIVGLSGGIDSAVVAALSVEALGKKNVKGLMLPEKESSPDSLAFAKKQAEKLGIEYEVFDITKVLDSYGVYRKRDEVIRRTYPEFGEGWKFKIVMPANLLDSNQLNFYSLKVRDPEGNEDAKRLSLKDWREIMACSNVKQRTRMTSLYHFAEIDNLMVAGTGNRSELIQGFIVKHGDGGVDAEPIGHLYKVQVYELANALPVIDEIKDREPTPDTFSLVVSDEEVHFRMKFDIIDLIMYAWEKGISNDEVAKALDLSGEQVERIMRDIRSKYKTTAHLREFPPDILSQ